MTCTVFFGWWFVGAVCAFIVGVISVKIDNWRVLHDRMAIGLISTSAPTYAHVMVLSLFSWLFCIAGLCGLFVCGVCVLCETKILDSITKNISKALNKQI